MNDNNINHYIGKRQREGVVREFVSLIHRRVEIPSSSSRADRRRQHHHQPSSATTATKTTNVQEERLDELVAPQRDGETRVFMTFPALSILPSQEALRWYSEQTLNNAVASFFFLKNPNDNANSNNGNTCNAEAADLAKRFAVSSLSRPLETTSRADIVQQEFLNVMAQNVAASLVRLVRAEFAKQQPTVFCHHKKRGIMDCASPKNSSENKSSSGAFKKDGAPALSKRIHVESGYLSFIAFPESSRDAAVKNADDNSCTVPIYCSMALQVSLRQANGKPIVVPVSLEATGRLTAQFEDWDSELISNVHISMDTEDLFASLRRQARAVVTHSLTVAQEAQRDDNDEDQSDNGSECYMSSDEEDKNEEENENRRMPPMSATKRQKRAGDNEAFSAATEDGEL